MGFSHLTASELVRCSSLLKCRSEILSNFYGFDRGQGLRIVTAMRSSKERSWCTSVLFFFLPSSVFFFIKDSSIASTKDAGYEGVIPSSQSYVKMACLNEIYKTPFIKTQISFQSLAFDLQLVQLKPS